MLSSREQAVEETVDGNPSHGSTATLSFTTKVVPEGMTKRQWKKHLRQQRKLITREENKWVN